MIGLPSPATTAPVSAAKDRQAISPRARRALRSELSACRVRHASSKSGRVGHPAALAHRLQPVPQAVAAHPVQQRRRQPGAGAAQRVAQRDRAALGIGARRVGAGLLQPGHRHAGERLVDLERRRCRPGRRPTASSSILGRRDRAGEHEYRVRADDRPWCAPGRSGVSPSLSHGVARRRPAVPPRRRTPGWPARRSAARPARSGLSEASFSGVVPAPRPLVAREPRHRRRSPRRTARRRSRAAPARGSPARTAPSPRG